MSTQWKRRPEGGSRFAVWLIAGISRYGGRALGRLLLYPIVAYFLLVRGQERHASRAYLERVFGRPATLVEVARHIHCFAATILDRVFLLSGQLRCFEFEVTGLTALHAQIDKARGVLLFGSHHGSFEVLRVLSRERPDVCVRVVMDRGQNPAITQLLETLSPDIAANVIDAAQGGTGIALAIRDAAETGAVIGLLVDRALPGEPVTMVPFLGQAAPFPSSPFLIAAALKVPVALCFGIYLGGSRYALHFEVFDECLDIPRRQRREMLAALQARYVARLEHFVRSAPYNWFNFYDFWNTDENDRATATRADGSDADGVVEPSRDRIGAA